MSESVNSSWQEEFALAALAVVQALPLGGHTTDPRLVERLGFGMEGLFLLELPSYDGWPAGSTIDGVTVHLCIRPGIASLEITGMLYIDFSDEECPARLMLEANEPGELMVRGFVGRAEGPSVAIQRLTGGPMILPGREVDGRVVSQLAHGHRQRPIPWALAFEGVLTDRSRRLAHSADQQLITPERVRDL